MERRHDTRFVGLTVALLALAGFVTLKVRAAGALVRGSQEDDREE